MDGVLVLVVVDMQREQDALVGCVYGHLRDYCRMKFGLEFYVSWLTVLSQAT